MSIREEIDNTHETSSNSSSDPETTPQYDFQHYVPPEKKSNTNFDLNSDIKEKIDKGEYFDLYIYDYTFNYSDEELLEFAMENSLISSREEIDSLILGHYMGFEAIRMAMKCKMMKQIPGPVKNLNSNNMQIISNLQNCTYDGKTIEYIIMNDGKRSLGDSVKLLEHIKLSCTKLLNPDKEHTLPFWDESIANKNKLTEDEKINYKIYLTKFKKELISRSQIHNFLLREDEDYIPAKLDSIIEFYINEILSV